MTPDAILTGRVIDEFGDPVENAFVTATPFPAILRDRWC
jgi:hypothetical protein